MLPVQRDLRWRLAPAEFEGVAEQLQQQLAQQARIGQHRRHIVCQLPRHLRLRVLFHEFIGHLTRQRVNLHRLQIQGLCAQP